MSLLPKSKEALAERYNSEQMKKSGYVDKWVDETVKVVQVHRKSESAIMEAPSTPLSTSSAAEAGESTTPPKPKSVKSDGTIESDKAPLVTIPPVIEAEDLSDFSDDADEILNNDESFDEPERTPSASEVEESVKKSDSEQLPPPTSSSSIVASQGSTPVIIRAPSEKAPSVASQDRTPAIKPYRLHEGQGRSVLSQSQTDDDILERMDFEEISEDELGEVETNKVHIVDALGIDWASLVCQEKISPVAGVSGSIGGSDSNINSSVRKRWNPVNMLACSGISKSLVGEDLYNRIMSAKKTTQSTELKEEVVENDKSKEEDNSKKQLQVLHRIGLGPNSRALSSRRDYAMR
jgi:hypothetical protein